MCSMGVAVRQRHTHSQPRSSSSSATAAGGSLDCDCGGGDSVASSPISNVTPPAPETRHYSQQSYHT
ncbi:hypothetical protein LSTR_LSTR016688 [Laodelphax striatellus]|uniref:Uncharacterized protein n=1 Tax=Laodelphax striatellus TaxID=195883 RepID=A0A482X552_LAOST|nr:hypothetical protein LSTR_LSTR016688 [Laodelphax striatellus]